MKLKPKIRLLASIISYGTAVTAVVLSLSVTAQAQSDLPAAPVVSSRSVPNQAGARVPQRSGGATIGSTKLPSVPSVRSMTSADASMESLLRRLPSDSAFDRANHESNSSNSESSSSSGEISANATTESVMDNYVFDRASSQRGWGGSTATWAAPNFYSQPLYFEQVNLERYGSKIPAVAQPAVSYAQFLTAIAVLPYKMKNEPYQSRAYSLGHWRPGDRVPHQIHWQHATKRGTPR